MFSCATVILYDGGAARVSGRVHQGYCSATMRVIAGKFRSRPLHSTHGLDIRPTADRLRETLFNVLTAGNPQALEGSVWVDLFAGTGAVGIEALSRGAAKVYFVEHSRRAAEVIKANLESLKISGGTEILQQEVSHAIPLLARRSLRANFVFLDPPYRLQDAYRETVEALARSEFAADALIITEHDKRFDPGERFADLARIRILQQGDAALSFYRRRRPGP
jgi:16S rRNA (guanine966-N2)-methyltransferase